MIPTNIHATLINALAIAAVRVTQNVTDGDAQTRQLIQIKEARDLVNRLQTQPVWEPVSVATFSTDNATLSVADNELSIITDTDDGVTVTSWTLPRNYGLCRRIEPQEGDSHE